MDALMLPSNWQRVRLGDIAEIKRGASPRPIENPKWFCANSNVGWVRISDISKNSRFLYKTAQKLSKKGIEKSRFIKQNSLIMSMCATIGKPIITKIDTCIHDGFVVFENPKIDLNYLYYFLCYIEKEWLESGQQGSQVNLNVDLIKNKEVFCPKDLNEQIAIANILSDVDHYLYSLDALILKKESVKKALSFELLSQKKRLKGFNQNWQRVRIGDIFFITAGGDLSKPHYSNTKQSDFNYPIYSNAIEKKGLYGYSSFFIIKNKSITITSRGTIGVAFFRDYPYVPIGRLLVLQPKISNIDCRFYAEYINSKVKFNTEQTTIPQLTIPKVALCEIPLPPLNEQIAIANVLSDLDHEIISLKNKKRQFENIKKALNHDLMSAKIRVLKN
ncbi:restriction endonuclease subunit S [Helicobacter pylori]|nr:restriction endonuclease subunit S [Helicobacter pylori]